MAIRRSRPWNTLGEDYFGNTFHPKPREIHVLVELPAPAAAPPPPLPTQSAPVDRQHLVVHEVFEPSVAQELAHYLALGHAIQRHHPDLCGAIQCKIDQLYKKRTRIKPFICVEGSSGMGKSQLAFALHGNVHSVDAISKTFNNMVNVDLREQTKDNQAMKSDSALYRVGKLWTFGFLYELVDVASDSEHQRLKHMIRFDNSITLRVARRTQDEVRDKIAALQAAGKSIPFFIVDEMTPNSEGTRRSAFQRNVFRVCGLVVVLMGTDSKITSMIVQGGFTRNGQHHWLTLVTRCNEYGQNRCSDVEFGSYLGNKFSKDHLVHLIPDVIKLLQDADKRKLLWDFYLCLKSEASGTPSNAAAPSLF